MKKQIFYVSIILLVCVGVSAQTVDKTVEKIRKVYDGISEKARLCENDADQGSYGDLVMNELAVNKSNHQWRAVGIYQLTYKFFYKGGDSEEHMYPDQLVMVKAEKHESNRTYNEEYLFNDAGALIFYFQRAENDNMVPAERRVYFSGIRAVRIVEDGKTHDRLSVKDAATVRDITSASTKIKALFAGSIKL